MNLNYSIEEIAQILEIEQPKISSKIAVIEFDSRRILSGNQTLFIALEGNFRDGHDFISDAYQKGVRNYLISNESYASNIKDANFLVVENVLDALVQLAVSHRKKYDVPVVGITGSYGKTIVKEWLNTLLSVRFNVARSPKSFNSKLGVATSIFELNESSEIGIFEAGIGGPNDMSILREMIQPTHGIFTSIGSAHLSNFESEQQLIEEKLQLFDSTSEWIYCNEKLNSSSGKKMDFTNYKDYFSSNWATFQKENGALAIEMAKNLGLSDSDIQKGVSHWQPLANRMEAFEGHSNSWIINNTYQFDLENLREALAFQKLNNKNKDRILVLGLDKPSDWKEKIEVLSVEFNLSEIHFLEESNPTVSIENKCVLVMGERNHFVKTWVNGLQNQAHRTYLEIDLKAIRKNINEYKNQLKDSTQLLCMVKASSYGASARQMGTFLESVGVNYLGVAYPNEGIELRNLGVQVPVMVMNADATSFVQLIENKLEPAIYSLAQLDAFIRILIAKNRSNYPIHIKLDTGMHRLGFSEKDIDSVINLVRSQPEVKIQSIYSHLATSDETNSGFVAKQVDLFQQFSERILNAFPYPIIRHILNSEGIVNYPEHQFDMVRLGIGMYGISQNQEWKKRMKPALKWMSTISQSRTLKVGEGIGYGQAFIAKEPTKVATIPVGYADGFRRSLSQGKGQVFIQNQSCEVLGNVCMDMIMVDVSSINCTTGDLVEIIGENQTIEDFAKLLETIPYEVMTSFSGRMHRIFTE